MFSDKELEERMHSEGKILVENFPDIVKNYYKSQYHKTGDFEFLYVKYTYYDEKNKIFSFNVGDYVSRPENKDITALLPFFIEPGAIEDVRVFCLEIPGVIDKSNLGLEVANRLPKGVTLISQEEMDKILLSAGYFSPHFVHYFFSMMDYPSYNVYANPVFIKSNEDKKHR